MSRITIDVELDRDKIPSSIVWDASESTAEKRQKARAMLVSFWDPLDRSALRLDLWTKDMMVDEMGDYFYQTFMGLADTFSRAVNDKKLTEEIQQFAKDFYKKFVDSQIEKNGLTPQ